MQAGLFAQAPVAPAQQGTAVPPPNAPAGTWWGVAGGGTTGATIGAVTASAGAVLWIGLICFTTATPFGMAALITIGVAAGVGALIGGGIGASDGWNQNTFWGAQVKRPQMAPFTGFPLWQALLSRIRCSAFRRTVLLLIGPLVCSASFQCMRCV
jgi:hypothetical protein